METDWQCKQTSLKDRNATLLNYKLWTDCTFSVGAQCQIFQAHKLILVSASPVFEKMFYGHMAEGTNKEILIEDIEADTFTALLEYIYTAAIRLESFDMAVALYYAAKKYMLEQLSKDCIEYLCHQLNPTDVLQTYEFAIFYDETKLMQAALEVMRNETKAVISSPFFMQINISTMITLLEQNKLAASELQLFKALDALAKSKGLFEEECSATEKTNEMAEFRRALKKIHFLSISPKKFAQEVAFSKLLSPEESLAILACLNQPLNINNRYPEGFSKGKRIPQSMPRNENNVAINTNALLNEYGSDLSSYYRSIWYGTIYPN